MKKAIALALVFAVCLFAAPLTALGLEGVCYEVYVRSYADFDGDGLGDLKGLTEKLDYIEALGAKSIWLMPVSPSPTYHKYDVTDYMSIDPEYGSLADFDALVKEASARGIGMILDLVVNHSSDEHPWFVSACRALGEGDESNPYIGYYHFSRDKGAGWHSVPGAEGWYYEGEFTPDMPDLNLDNPAVRAEIADIARFWLERGVKGFRLDAVIHYTQSSGGNIEFMSWLCNTVKEIRPDAYIVGEAWKEQAEIERLYESKIQSMFNFAFGGQDGAIVRAVKNSTGAAYAKRLCEWNEAIRAVSPYSTDSLFLSNHDIARSAGYFPRDERAMKSAAALYILSPGTPFVYYGEEIGLTGSGRDENKRLPMLWDSSDAAAQCRPPENADQSQRQTLGVKQQQEDENSLLAFYRRVIALRKLCPALDTACPEYIDTGFDAVAAYRVSDASGSYEVYHNLGDIGVSVKTKGTLLGGLAALGNAPALVSGELTLPEYSSCVLLLSGGEQP